MLVPLAQKHLITRKAKEEGYDLVGFAPVALEQSTKDQLEEFAKQKLYGNMLWWEKSLEIRKNPSLFASDAKSAIVLGSYYRDLRSEKVLQKAKLKISRYAHGKDYHKYLHKRARRLFKQLQKSIPHLKGRISVDSSPVAEKSLAVQAGIGWQGKHTNIIHKDWGSYFFLSVLFVNIDLPVDEMHVDLCGSCNLCIEACPTQALRPYEIDPRKCISYHTIESPEPRTSFVSNNKSQDSARKQKEEAEWVFGCDICQEVCPYNRNRRTRFLHSSKEAFSLRKELSEWMQSSAVKDNRDESELLSNKYNKDNKDIHWEELSRGTALRRVSYEKFLSNQLK